MRTGRIQPNQKNMKFFDKDKIDRINLEKEKISRLQDEKIADFEAQIMGQLDVDFSLVEQRVHTMEEFESQLKAPFLQHSGNIFYRGERVNDRSRPLIPTIFRNRNALFDSGEAVAEVDADFVYDYYSRVGDYLALYKRVMDENPQASMYRLCAFSQHYLDVSPFVDFTKSLYVSLSFALKNRKVYQDNLVLYTVKIINEADYTQEESVANRWLKDYRVYVFRRREDYIRELISGGGRQLRQMMQQMDKEKLELFKIGNSPSAKLISIPTNDLMRYQQGVFLLLTDFKLMFDAYPTKSIRDDFEVTKWIISKDICPQLLELVNTEAPWYSYDCLLDVKKAFQKAARLHS